MRGFNRVFLMGHLGHDPVVRHTTSGRAVCDLRIASNRSIKRGEAWEEQVDWVTVRLWEQRAELALRFLKKGSALAIEGSLREDRWTDNQNNKRSRLLVHADSLTLLPNGRPSGPGETGAEPLDRPMDRPMDRPDHGDHEDEASIPF